MRVKVTDDGVLIPKGWLGDATEVELVVENGRVVLIPSGESHFWLAAGQSALAEVWDNPDDDVYAQLVKK